jgi:adenosylcobinamide-GDP ribazoletransferase
VIKALFSLFTIIPVDVTGEDVDQLSHKFWTAPIIGAFYGLVAAGLFFSLTMVFEPLVSAALVVLVVHGLNRFLHLDGLTDLGDGLIATGTQEKKLAAMKDTRVGAGGVGFTILITILLVTALASTYSFQIDALIIFLPLAMEVLAKNSLVTVAALGKEREGLGSPFVRNTPPHHAVLSAVLSLAILIPVILVFNPWAWPYSVLLAGVVVLTSSIVGAVMASQATRSFGCVNGDVMGATNEVAKPFVLLIGMAGVSLFLSML